jgi:septum formation protein
MSWRAMSNLILASASPRRQHLLKQLGLPFDVMPADIDESWRVEESPEDYVKRLAYAKAWHLAPHNPMAFVLGADTIVTIDGEILGKPRDAGEARAMLQRLSGRRHDVLTGLALLHHHRAFTRIDSVRTSVWFRPLSDADIDAYMATGEPFDKAGSYAIQGDGSRFVDGYDGCYTNVVGLPIRRTAALLRAAGLTPSA